MLKCFQNKHNSSVSDIMTTDVVYDAIYFEKCFITVYSFMTFMCNFDLCLS